MISKKLEGIIIALPTPLLENENIDTVSLGSLVNYCIEQGASGIMISGTMGEGVCLLDDQRQILVESTVEHAAGRIPVLATVSAASTRRSIERVKAIERTGVDYIVCTSAFYNKFPDPKSLLFHIEKISEAIELPLIFYNAPGFTGNSVDVDTLEKILNLEKIAGIKDSSCQFSSFAELLRRYPDKETRPGTIMQGDESVFDASLLMGADGIISGGGVLYIPLLVKLYKASLAHNLKDAINHQRHFYSQLLELLLPNPQRDWVSNIKKRLVDQRVISNAYVTAPFLSS